LQAEASHELSEISAAIWRDFKKGPQVQVADDGSWSNATEGNFLCHFFVTENHPRN